MEKRITHNVEVLNMVPSSLVLLSGGRVLVLSAGVQWTCDCFDQ